MTNEEWTAIVEYEAGLVSEPKSRSSHCQICFVPLLQGGFCPSCDGEAYDPQEIPDHSIVCDY